MKITQGKTANMQLKSETEEKLAQRSNEDLVKASAESQGATGSPLIPPTLIEELQGHEKVINYFDRDRTDAPYYIGERLNSITSNENLLYAGGFSSASEYLRSSLNRLGIKKSTAFNYLNFYKNYHKYIKEIIYYKLDIENHPEALLKPGYLMKMLLLDKALERINGEDINLDVIFDHFINDSYREFRIFAIQGIEREEEWKTLWAEWSKEIRNIKKAKGDVLIIPFIPNKISRTEINGIYFNTRGESK